MVFFCGGYNRSLDPAIRFPDFKELLEGFKESAQKGGQPNGYKL
jgi:hypothetical protein